MANSKKSKFKKYANNTGQKTAAKIIHSIIPFELASVNNSGRLSKYLGVMNTKSPKRIEILPPDPEHQPYLQVQIEII